MQPESSRTQPMEPQGNVLPGSPVRQGEGPLGARAEQPPFLVSASGTSAPWWPGSGPDSWLECWDTGWVTGQEALPPEPQFSHLEDGVIAVPTYAVGHGEASTR